jgi:AcrR family transcriptional regulator
VARKTRANPGASGNRTVQNNRRNPKETRDRIIRAAQTEFARHGYGAARIERISTSARSNVRMIYHYFGGKENLYLVVLENAYWTIRALEQRIAFHTKEPIEGMRQLVELTFDHLSADPFFVRLIMNENLMMGRMARKSKQIPSMTRPLLNALDILLRRGQEQALFNRQVDSVHLYIAILGLCFIHVSNRFTLSNMLQTDLADTEWLKERRSIVADIIMSYLTRGTMTKQQARSKLARI